MVQKTTAKLYFLKFIVKFLWYSKKTHILIKVTLRIISLLLIIVLVLESGAHRFQIITICTKQELYFRIIH